MASISRRRLGHFFLKAIVYGVFLSLPLLVTLLDFPASTFAGCSQYGYGCTQVACLGVEVNTTGGTSSGWRDTSPYIYGPPSTTTFSSEISICVRTVLGAISGPIEGWSFGLRHTVPSNLTANGGFFKLDAVQPASMTVQNGSAPDYKETKIRTSGSGYTQGVVIDLDQSMYKLNSPATVYTSNACYKVKFPTQTGVYPVTLNLTDDVGDPPIQTIVTQGSQTKVPCKFNLTLNIYASSYPPTPSYSCGLSTTPPIPTVLKLAIQPDSSLPIPCKYRPFLRGDANGDGNRNISDAQFILSFLFLGGPAPLCLQAANVDRSLEPSSPTNPNAIKITDPIRLLNSLFINGQPLPSPGSSICETDFNANGTTDDGLDCRYTSAACGRVDDDSDKVEKACEDAKGSSDTQIDSDGDLLSDYDEIYAHGTSPAKLDTDGDGISDKAELDSLSDPNFNPQDFDISGDFPVAPDDSDPLLEYDLITPVEINCNLSSDRSAVSVPLRARVRWPDFAQATPTNPLPRNPPYPLVFLLHGQHHTCFKMQNGQILSTVCCWPCGTATCTCSGCTQCPQPQTTCMGSAPIQNYRGLDYISKILASWGFIAVSIDANPLNANFCQYFDGDIGARVQLLQEHMKYWHKLNCDNMQPPYNGLFKDKVDLDNIGAIGHSRGGEAVIIGSLSTITSTACGPARPLSIDTVFGISPSNAYRASLRTEVPFGLLLPYCDGDVKQLPNVQMFDDSSTVGASAALPDASRHMFLVMGANHDFFNTAWDDATSFPDSNEDWSYPTELHCGLQSSRRLTGASQRAIGGFYIASFFRFYMLRDYPVNPGKKGGFCSELLAILKGDAAPFFRRTTNSSTDTPIVLTKDVFVSFTPTRDTTLALNRLNAESKKVTNDLQGQVSATETTNGGLIEDYGFCGGTTGDCIASTQDHQPHTTNDGLLGITPSSTCVAVNSAPMDLSDLGQLRITWREGLVPTDSDRKVFKNTLPLIDGQPRDLREFSMLQFRVAVNYRDYVNNTQPKVEQDFSIVLTDGTTTGTSPPVRVSQGNIRRSGQWLSASVVSGRQGPYDFQAAANNNNAVDFVLRVDGMGQQTVQITANSFPNCPNWQSVTSACLAAFLQQSITNPPVTCVATGTPTDPANGFVIVSSKITGLASAIQFIETSTQGKANRATLFSTAEAKGSDGPLYFPPGSDGFMLVPRLLLNSVRIPLECFGDFRKRVTEIKFVFDQPLDHRGSLIISDILLIRKG